MTHDVRRWGLWGGVAGGLTASASALLFALLSTLPITELFPGVLVHVAAAVLSGCGYALLLYADQRRTGRLPTAALGLLYGLAHWVIFSLILIPLLAAQPPQWQSGQAAAQFAPLLVYLLYGLLFTMAARLFAAQGWLSIAPAAQPTETVTSPRQIVILGGGFAGVTTAQTLEKLLHDDPTVQITLISRTNHLLFTPMLAEVTAGGVEAQHISPPLRAFFQRVRVIRGEPIALDSAASQITVRTPTGAVSQIAYAHLVCAVGAVPNFFGNRNLERHAFTFKSLADAVHIRNHVIECLERADAESDPARRAALLTFVVVGAGFAGSELIGGLNDFVRGSLGYYRHIQPDEVRLLLLHPRDRILPELSEQLARYAEEKMRGRGVTIRGGAKVTDAARGSVQVGDETIPTETLIWTAGNVPNPILKALGLETDKRGALLTDATLRVQGAANIWALGDCAVVPDTVTGTTAPPTAQYALRQAKALGHTLHAVLHGKEAIPFSHRSQGALAVVGHQTACAEVFGLRFSGLFAWLMWRGIYLAKLPTFEKKTRVLLDWIIDIFFPRDITATPLPEDLPEAMTAAGE